MIKESPRTKQLLEKLENHPLPAKVDLKLDRIKLFLERLGNPHLSTPPIVHIAGTNGKGSLLAHLKTILQESGLRVHAYSSPHLVSFHERIILDRKPIDDNLLGDILEEVVEASQEFPTTYFESTMAAAFLAFSRSPADILLLEVGLGGRLDATNVIDSPALTAITPISFDHTEFLGDSLADIAGEKAGIIKDVVPCVIGKQPSEALEKIEDIAKQRKSSTYIYEKDFTYEEGEGGFYYKSNISHYELISESNRQSDKTLKQVQSDKTLFTPSLVGKHQYHNAACAIACTEQLAKAGHITMPSDENIAKAIAKTEWKARLQKLSNGKLTDIIKETSTNKNIKLWLDGGHNPAAGQVIADWAKEQGQSLHLIIGMIKGKDVAGFLAPLKEYVTSVHCITIPNEQSSMSSAELYEKTVTIIDTNKVTKSNSVESSINDIIISSQNPANILIAGSLYLAGQILRDNQ